MPTLTVPSVQASTSSFTYVYGSGSSITVDPNITVTQGPNSFPLDGVYATILTGFTSGDALSIDGATATTSGDNTTYTGGVVPTGVSAVYNATTGVLKCVISGVGSNTYLAATWQAIMRAVKFSTSAVSTGNTSRGFSFTLGEKQALTVSSTDETGANVSKPHYYEFVSKPHVTWIDARAEAKTKTFFGLQGYLACITSQAENDFILNKIRQADGNIPRGWIGATDLADPTRPTTTAGTYKWVDGPEAGTTLSYANYSAGEPNNVVQAQISPNGEHFLHFMPSGQWNDLPGSGPVVDGNNNVSPNTNIWTNNTWATVVVPTYSLLGYVIEYGGFSTDPALTISTSLTINLTSVDNAVTANAADIVTLKTKVASLQAITAPKGPIGNTGPSGAKGAIGDAGAKGATGDQGATGATGPAGPAGAIGINGNAGAQGAAGANGARGPQGATGAKGAIGDQGPAGPIGPQGATGAKGSKGARGDAGPQGLPGILGNIGAQGPKGLIGDKGPVGNTGGTGIQGGIGDAGPIGDHGDIGPIGAIGPVGDVGPAGTDGLVGAPGAKGALGQTGPSGDKGPKGDIGDTGAQGPIGDAGAIGAIGADGPIGEIGDIGPKGLDADTFNGIARVNVLEAVIHTKEDVQAHINSLFSDGISDIAVNALKNALDDAYVTTAELQAASDYLDTQINAQINRLDHLSWILHSKTLCIAKKVSFAV